MSGKGRGRGFGGQSKWNFSVGVQGGLGVRYGIVDNSDI